MTDHRTAEEIATYYENIRAAYRQAEDDQRMVTRFYHESVLDNMKARHAGGFPDAKFEQYWEEKLRLIQQTIRNLYSRLPCEAFAERFGYVLHELYKEKYPIYAATKVEDVGWLPGGPMWTYVVPAPLTMDFTTDPDAPPPWITSRQYTVPIEVWAESGSAYQRGSVYRLAYANEIDTVLVFPKV